jgi:hypothetical protein
MFKKQPVPAFAMGIVLCEIVPMRASIEGLCIAQLPNTSYAAIVL